MSLKTGRWMAGRSFHPLLSANSGYLPADPERLYPVVRKALRDKLRKLAATDASERLLLLEMPMIPDSPNRVIDIVDRSAIEFPEI